MKTIRRVMALAAVGASSITPWAQGQVLFSEGFDSSATANVVGNASGGANMEVRYLDYASFTVGSQVFAVPEAPSSATVGGLPTHGVLMRSTYDGTARIANLFPATGPGGTPLTFSGNYKLSFDMWLSLDQTATTSSTGTTEIGLWGIGTDNNVPIGRTYRSSVKGTWGWLSVDGGFGATVNNGDAAFRSNGVQVAILENPTQPAKWQEAWPSNPNLPGTTPIINPPWNSWTSVEVTAIEGEVSVKFNGVEFFRYANMPTTGFAVIGYEDPFTSSTSFSPDWQWGLFDNIQIVAIPEPNSLGLLLLSGVVGLCFRRRI